MEDKYNHSSLEQYSRDLAKLLCDRYFANQETINGQQLMAFSPVKQLNLFVIKELLIRWNQEMANLKSPYFDFSDEDVISALKQFMNVLSRKILLRRPHFEPLLQKAIQDTFTLVLDPATSFDEKFLKMQEEITQARLQEHVKYLDLNKAVFSDFLQTLPPQTPDKASLLGKFRLFSQARYHDFTPVAALLDQLNVLLPISKNDILAKTATQTHLNPASEPASGPMHNIAAPAENASFDKASVPASGPTGPASFPQPETAQPPIPAPAAEIKPVSTAVTSPSEQPEVKLYEKFKAEKPSLNETLKRPDAPILAEKDTRKIESLKESISINQRFSFINELFNGENMEYHEAIQKLDAFPDAASAKNYLLQDLAGKHNWAKKEEHLNKLLRLIDRKFA